MMMQTLDDALAAASLLPQRQPFARTPLNSLEPRSACSTPGADIAHAFSPLIDQRSVTACLDGQPPFAAPALIVSAAAALSV